MTGGIGSTKKYETKDLFIAYFDILGFENKVGYGTDEEEYITPLAAIDGIITNTEELIAEAGEHGRSTGIKLKAFSDNFFLCTEYDYQLLVGMIGCLQAALASIDYFIRGALIYGNAFCTDKFVYGKGLIEAYKLESEIALFPRILCDNSFIMGAARIEKVTFKEICESFGNWCKNYHNDFCKKNQYHDFIIS